MSPGVVFVVYQPDQAAVANLKHAARQCSALLVVDNTPIPDPALRAELAPLGLEPLDNHNAGGLAGAYNRGIEELVRRGCDLFFLLDQDTELPEDFFAQMVSTAGGLGQEAFLLGPVVYEVRMDRYLPDVSAGVDEGSGRVRATDFLISSGSAVSLAAYRQLGRFCEELFIECVDVEYCFRAIRDGVPVLVDTGVVLRQYTGAITQHGRWFTTNHSAVRRYYLVRNVVATQLRYRALAPSLRRGLRLVVRELMVVARFERDRVRKSLCILVGALDGIRGRLGTLDQRHPRISAACAGSVTPSAPR